MTQNTGTSVNRNSQGTGSNWILYGIIVALISGALVGGFLPDFAKNLKFIGDFFMNSLMMVVVPLVMVSMIVGITSIGDIREVGTLGWRTMIYFLATTAIAVLIGIILVNTIRPGKGMGDRTLQNAPYQITGNTMTLLGGATFQKTTYHDPKDRGYPYVIQLKDQNIQGRVSQLAPMTETTLSVEQWVTAEGSRATPNPTGSGVEVASEKTLVKRTIGSVLSQMLVDLIPRNIFDSMAKMQVLPLIVFSLLFGGVLTTLGERGRTAIEFFEGVNEAIMKIVYLVMVIAPFGIFGLIAARIGEAGGFLGFMPELIKLGKYFLTVVIGLFIHGVIILPLILAIVGKRNPITFTKNMGPALLNAFSTASSSATLPLTIECVEQRNGISRRTASFVLPLGATINMNGTALYEAVAAIFMAQVYDIHLGLVPMVLIFLTATLAAIGAAGIPEAGLVTMVIVLTAVNLPLEGITLILTIDWLLDRFRTTVNVWGDAVGAGVIETLESGDTSKAAQLA